MGVLLRVGDTATCPDLIGFLTEHLVGCNSQSPLGVFKVWMSRLLSPLSRPLTIGELFAYQIHAVTRRCLALGSRCPQTSGAILFNGHLRRPTTQSTPRSPPPTLVAAAVPPPLPPPSGQLQRGPRLRLDCNEAVLSS